MTYFRHALSLLLCGFITTAAFADVGDLGAFATQGLPTPNISRLSAATIFLKANSASEGAPARDIAIHVDVVPLQNSSEAAAVIHDGAENLTIVSADDDDGVVRLAHEPSLALNRHVAFVKGSELRALVRRMGQRPKHIGQQYQAYVKDSVTHDPVGLCVLTYSVGFETFRWIHMAHLSEFARTSNIAYTIATALVFSVNAKLWVRYNRSIQQRLRKVLKLAPPIEGAHIDARSIGVQFLSSWILTTALNLGRVPLMLDSSLQQSSAFSMIELPLLTSLIGTASGFAWSELYAKTDADKTPRTAVAVMWAKNARNFLLASFASTAMLLNYQEYGLRPWVEVAISGVLGIALYYNADTIIKFLDHNARTCRAVLTD